MFKKICADGFDQIKTDIGISKDVVIFLKANSDKALLQKARRLGANEAGTSWELMEEISSFLNGYFHNSSKQALRVLVIDNNAAFKLVFLEELLKLGILEENIFIYNNPNKLKQNIMNSDFSPNLIISAAGFGKGTKWTGFELIKAVRSGKFENTVK